MWQVKLRTKIFGGFLFLILLSSIMAYLGWHQLRTLQMTVERQQNYNFITKTLLETRRQEKNFFLRGDQKYIDQANQNLETIKARVAQARRVLSDPTDQKHLTQIMDYLGRYEVALENYAALHHQQGVLSPDRQRRLSQLEQAMVTPARELLRVSQEAQESQEGRIQSQLVGASRLMGYSVLLAIALGIVVSVALVRTLTKTLNRVISGLGDGSDQVAAASLEVSSASQSLAAGTSQQAASLEQTTSSLEELAATVKQNSLHAEHCNELVLQTHEKTRAVHKSIRATKEFMETISSSGESIKKIIKNIDEIAFQTNLLALNAAVEAARAGEAGAGFAVVAEEVRGLAMRAAEAAKTTDDLIGETSRQIELGSAQIQETLTKFYDMGDSAKKVNELVGEIANASIEQAQGIEQLNQAMLEIDRVVQQNAANAQESASASSELQAQSERMREIVGEMAYLVGNGLQQLRHAEPAGNGQHHQGVPASAESRF